jgi:hypothetical protein
MSANTLSSLSCLLACPLLGLLFGLIGYVLLGDDGVGVAGHTSLGCSDLEMPELDLVDRDFIVIGFCEQQLKLLTSSGRMLLYVAVGNLIAKEQKLYRPTCPNLKPMMFFLVTINDFNQCFGHSRFSAFYTRQPTSTV